MIDPPRPMSDEVDANSPTAHFHRVEHWFHVLATSPPETWASRLLSDEPDSAIRDEVLRLLQCAQAPEHPLDEFLRDTPSDPRAGRVVGAWRLLGELGSGGMGTVYEAERIDGRFASRVAIKMLRPHTSEALRSRFIHERQILASLNHPHIARLIDAGETAEGEPYLVMERVVGEPLATWMSARSPDRDGRLRLFERLVSAVAHAHQRLVIHRDIKPSNVMVREDGQPVLLDFGVAKLIEPSAAEAWQAPPTRVFTHGYASPEQVQGQPVTTATDIFSLGVLLRELLTGVTPTQPDGAPPRWPPVPIDAELRGVIACATAPDASARYANADALAEDIGRWRAGLPLRTAPDRAWYRARKFIARHRWGVATACLIMTAAAAAAWRIADERDRAVQAEQQARIALARSERQLRFLSNFFLGVGQRDSNGQLPDANRLLDRAREAIAGEEIIDRAGASGLQLMLGEAYLYAGRWNDASSSYARGLAGTIDRIEPIDRAEALRNWARAELQAHRPDEALRIVERARAMVPRQPTDRSWVELDLKLRVTQIQALAATHPTQGDTVPAEVEAALRSALSVARREFPRGHVLLGTLLMEDALARERAHQFDQLVAIRREALTAWEADPRAVAIDLAVQRRNLARALWLTGAVDAEADALLDAAAPAFETHFGATGMATLAFDRARLALARHDETGADRAYSQGLAHLRQAQRAPDADILALGDTIARAASANAKSPRDPERRSSAE